MIFEISVPGFQSDLCLFLTCAMTVLICQNAFLQMYKSFRLM